MKEITLKIPDKKWVFFLELVEHLGFEVSEEAEISEEHKSIVRERIRSSKLENMVPWEEAQKQLIVKAKP